MRRLKLGVVVARPLPLVGHRLHGRRTGVDGWSRHILAKTLSLGSEATTIRGHVCFHKESRRGQAAPARACLVCCESLNNSPRVLCTLRLRDWSPDAHYRYTGPVRHVRWMVTLSCGGAAVLGRCWADLFLIQHGGRTRMAFETELARTRHVTRGCQQAWHVSGGRSLGMRTTQEGCNPHAARSPQPRQ